MKKVSKVWAVVVIAVCLAFGVFYYINSQKNSESNAGGHHIGWEYATVKGKVTLRASNFKSGETVTVALGKNDFNAIKDELEDFLFHGDKQIDPKKIYTFLKEREIEYTRDAPFVKPEFIKKDSRFNSQIR